MDNVVFKKTNPSPPPKKNHMHNFVYGVKSAIKKITVN